ncbi:hypothetical protein GCM10010174_38000 [Kutzneria viridogrisea]|uniref:HTH araC/xylS-type domain-containing protein n=2 Tax=Kutzneria TaxID=43356 RepID=W5W7X0_9PSEU|nr:helix-turn-helix domain-containing protein [Kutzneria albida]AHH97037.1 hypothetical protein KALB_3673 [Kutzneria albida DSM 43870]MBA8931996.1 AraC-like DNA-binding protein [Kutzneria viridogrisea]
MPERGALLAVERFDFATSDPEVVQAKIGELYVKNRTHHSNRGGFTLRVSRHAVGDLGIDQVRCRGLLSMDTEPFRDLWFGFLRSGRWSGTTRREELRGQTGLTYTHPTRDAIAYTLRDLDQYVMALPADAVRRVAAERFGHDQVRFLAMAPVSAQMQAYWRSAGDFARRQLCEPDSVLREPLVHAQMMDLLAGLALATFPNSTMTADYLPGPGGVGPATLRRAVAFIEAHADQPLTLSGIAAAARVSPRALQYAFRSHHSTTPLGYLRRVRLDRAHQDLLAADPASGDTVPMIARRWGFGTLFRFSALYRATYGRSPGHTLSCTVQEQ